VKGKRVRRKRGAGKGKNRGRKEEIKKKDEDKKNDWSINVKKRERLYKRRALAEGALKKNSVVETKNVGSPKNNFKSFIERVKVKKNQQLRRILEVPKKERSEGRKSMHGGT